MELPIELIFFIFNYLDYDKLHNYVSKTKFIKYTIFKYKVNESYALGIYNNVFNNCFLCNTQLTTNYLMNFCSCCSSILDKYPMICNICSKKYEPKVYGSLVHAKCINCNKKAIHLNINYWS